MVPQCAGSRITKRTTAASATRGGVAAAIWPPRTAGAAFDNKESAPIINRARPGASGSYSNTPWGLRIEVVRNGRDGPKQKRGVAPLLAAPPLAPQI